jgi:hypothetical protein
MQHMACRKSDCIVIPSSTKPFLPRRKYRSSESRTPAFNELQCNYKLLVVAAMDGLGAAAGVIQVIQISAQVFDSCRTYYLQVKSARKEIQRLRDEVISLQDVLANVADLADSAGSAKLSTLALLDQADGPIAQCHKELSTLAEKLDLAQGKDEMKAFGLRALKWPFSSKDVDKAISDIERYKASFDIALSVDQM